MRAGGGQKILSWDRLQSIDQFWTTLKTNHKFWAILKRGVGEGGRKSLTRTEPGPEIHIIWDWPIYTFLGDFLLCDFWFPLPPPTHPPLQKMTKLKMTRYQIFPLEFHLYSSARIYSRRRAASRIIVCALCWQCVCYRKPISISNKFKGGRAVLCYE